MGGYGKEADQYLGPKKDVSEDEDADAQESESGSGSDASEPSAARPVPVKASTGNSYKVLAAAVSALLLVGGGLVYVLLNGVSASDKGKKAKRKADRTERHAGKKSR